MNDPSEKKSSEQPLISGDDGPLAIPLPSEDEDQRQEAPDLSANGTATNELWSDQKDPFAQAESTIGGESSQALPDIDWTRESINSDTAELSAFSVPGIDVELSSATVLDSFSNFGDQHASILDESSLHTLKIPDRQAQELGDARSIDDWTDWQEDQGDEDQTGLSDEQSKSVETSKLNKQASAVSAEFSAVDRQQSAQRDALIEAFLAGARIDKPEIAGRINPEHFFLLGRVVSMALQSLIDQTNDPLSMARYRSRYRRRTTDPIQSINTAQQALLMLIDGRLSYETIQASYEAHGGNHSTLLTTVQRVVKALIKPIGPEQLADQLSQQKSKTARLPLLGRLALWKQFVQRYRTLEEELDDDFQHLLERAFGERDE